MTNQERIQANNTELQECIELAESLPDADGGITPSGTIEITENGEYDVTEYASANVRIESDSGDNPFQYATFEEGGLFYRATFPENYKLTIACVGSTYPADLGYTFQYAKNLTELTLNVGSWFSANSMCRWCEDLKRVNFPNGAVMRNAWGNAFSGCENLESINGELDYSNVTHGDGIFSNCKKLRDITFKPNSIKITLSVSNTDVLSDASIQSIIDGLATVSTTKYLYLHETVKAKLTQTQLDAIAAKKWSL